MVRNGFNSAHTQKIHEIIRFQRDCLQYIQRCLPRLHDEIMPSSLREIAFLGPSIQTFINDWNPDGVERCAEA